MSALRRLRELAVNGLLRLLGAQGLVYREDAPSPRLASQLRTPQASRAVRARCTHPELITGAVVTRIQEEGAEAPSDFRIQVDVHCAVCGERFAWRGVPGGFFADRPTVTIDGLSLWAPLVPALQARSLLDSSDGTVGVR